MSAQAQMRAMLDQLMGTSRDGDTTRQRIKFSDDRVCKSHLLNCCPHDVLSGTNGLGECLKVHDLALRADYEIASKDQDFFFELDAMDHLQSFIADCDRRTEVAKKRLAETQEEISAEVAAKAERVHELNEEIGKLLAKVETAWRADGNVEESQKVMDEVEKARVKKREAEEVYRNSMPASSFQQQKLRVCEVCSAYLGLHDNDRRLADHFGGKTTFRFIEIREKLEELRDKMLIGLVLKSSFLVPVHKEDDKHVAKFSEKICRNAWSKNSLLSRSHSKHAKRSRSRDRRRHRSRSASRERKRRTRSKSREKRHRHRSRSNSRSRSRSHHRSRHSSRERSRERSLQKRSSKERSSRDKERSRDRDRTSRDKDRSPRERSPRDFKDRKRSYESANGRSEDPRSSEEREAGEI
ncbi:LOW QUALITY PROTEIN: putative RNA-binding protein Luc7-like 2 [Nyctibius grandis]|uniref:LOW QUALITY PROTEIN: putative RNA-binding protein Luc7-like 2 n=1 Tax=Nyctibius grandis TaxID=48427 RepID=UPI0035BC96D0